ncbi:adenine phosphoribosyltransferase [Polynucleobacter kasalickyi]|uniref:Adenine phosphoribosyltransferase n=1 Tax=Polynucleobacter kasalickyi TaxID=1938817 RepID=A0A1W2C2F3_9BURK|nr:adenine phosphoribosyltransferase [Polynucleobacter kasalickyi]SMC79271.1 adenine phosphoribosyltransferase [Polynucleobacter kasalickyi]
MNLLDYLPTIPDFPKPGIMFKDISPLLANQTAFSYAIDQLHELSTHHDFDYILGIESRGFIFATALAQKSKKGLVLARKPNKLPKQVFSENYGLEYGKDSLEIQQDILPKQSKILLIDDVLATGGTLIAAANLVKKSGAKVVGSLVLLEIFELMGRERLLNENIPSNALIKI